MKQAGATESAVIGADNGTRTSRLPAWFQPGTKVWLGCKDLRIDELHDDGSIVLRMTRRGGYVRYAYTAIELDLLLASGDLREYLRTAR